MGREEALKAEISDRLQRALEWQGDRSIRSLESAMTAKGSQITSYGAIRSYVQGERLPPLTFLVDAAEELSVRSEWLILGRGEMTEAAEHVAYDEGELLSVYPDLALWPEPARDVLLGMIVNHMTQAPDLLSLESLLAGTEIS